MFERAPPLPWSVPMYRHLLSDKADPSFDQGDLAPAFGVIFILFWSVPLWVTIGLVAWSVLS